MSDPDPVAMRLPVFMQPTDAEARGMWLFQYPLRPRWRPYNLDALKSARARVQQPRVELTLGRECEAKHHDEESESPLSAISLASTTTRAKTAYAVGMLRVDERGAPVALCLSPLDESLQLRPSFAEIDAAEGKASEGGPSRADDDFIDDGEEGALSTEGEEDAGGGSGATVAPQFRPAQTEREIEARRSSHAYLVEQREAEPWSAATLHPADSAESHAVRELCFGREGLA